MDEITAAWDYFKSAWTNYLKSRCISDGGTDPVFPSVYDVQARDDFYKSLSLNGWGGSSGHDAAMIAYDAILAAGSSWHKLCDHAVFHGGDNDSTGTMAAAWFGAMYGFEGVPVNNYERLEYRDRMETLGRQLYELGQKQ